MLKFLVKGGGLIRKGNIIIDGRTYLFCYSRSSSKRPPQKFKKSGHNTKAGHL